MKSRWCPTSTPKWSMRPFTAGSAMLPAGSSGASWARSDAGARRQRDRHQAALRVLIMSGLLFQRKAPGQAQPEFADELVSGVRYPHADVERKIVPHGPDRADEPGAGARASGSLLAEDLGNRAQRPAVRALEDRPEEQIGLVLARIGERRVQMQRSRLPALRHDSGDGSARAALSVHLGKQDAVLGGDTQARPALQHAAAQQLLDEDAAVGQRRARL